jgi:hypothetical protein
VTTARHFFRFSTGIRFQERATSGKLFFQIAGDQSDLLSDFGRLKTVVDFVRKDRF